MNISATEIWTRGGEVAVEVRGQTSYRVVFDSGSGEAHILAPGLDRTLELDEDFYPFDEPEVCAIMLVAQLEGGIEL
jgi:hypothetical protein